MLAASTILGCVIGGCLLAVGYAYAGYPVVVAACARLFGRTPVRPRVADADLPAVTLVIAALNEAHEIAARIENALESDYPAGKLTILVASDGSKDDTVAIVRRYAHRGVQVADFPVNRGKATVLNDVLPGVTTPLVMLSDANTYTDRGATRKLAAWFHDPEVGVVCGKLILTDPESGRNADGLYWKYETFLKTQESKLGALLGSNGAIYAMRTDLYQPIPADTIVDDFVIPLLARQKTGCRIVYDTGAVATEETPALISSEFQRRARIGAGGFQALGLLKGLFQPRYGWLAFALANHKLLRWCCPFLLAVALVGNVGWVLLSMPGLGAEALLPTAALLLAAQVGFYALSLLSVVVPNRPKAFKALRLPALFTSMNAALGVGFYRYCRGRQRAAWKRTARTGESAAALALLMSMDDTKEMMALQQPVGATTGYSDDTIVGVSL